MRVLIYSVLEALLLIMEAPESGSGNVGDLCYIVGCFRKVHQDEGSLKIAESPSLSWVCHSTSVAFELP